MPYDFTAIESKWQERWAQRNTFKAANPGDAGFDAAKPKYYVLDMFPYPSGVGLHVGHPLGYIATDIVSRYKRMRGFAVLHPMGYDAFGLPAEQFAVEHGVHPRITTEKNIANMTRQLKQLGLSYDWDRSFATIDPDYYRWTQWIFLQLYNSWFDPAEQKAKPISELVKGLMGEEYYIDASGELSYAGGDEDLEAFTGGRVGVRKWHEFSKDEQQEIIDDQRLAYLDEVPVNWCPALGTVLANEEVTNEGRSERGNHPVFKRPLKQWMLRITAYAERLADDLDLVDWPESTKALQRNWIGRSEGAQVDFALAFDAASMASSGKPVLEEEITIFTTRPDTLFGATYMVLAPEHPLVEQLVTPAQQPAVADYQKQAAAKTNIDRQTEALGGKKTGVFTGAFAVNPVNSEKIPIWIADYVMMGYGTGAIMAVPGHDQRDFEFARQFDLPIRAVVMPDAHWLTAHAAKGGQDAPPVGDTDLTQQLRSLYLCDPAQFGEAFCGEGASVNSANDEVSLNSLETAGAKDVITKWLEARGVGKGTVQYKVRDWLFSRQRYWGEPFPILHGPAPEHAIVALDESELPVLLPDMENFQPTTSDDPDAPPQPPLSRAPERWKQVDRHGLRYTREFNTMPQWAGSCWYYLRFLDNHNAQRFVGKEAEAYWMKGPKEKGSRPTSNVQGPTSKSRVPAPGASSAPSATSDVGRATLDPALGARSGGVDLYVGGVEHAVLHLLYARFWHKVLFDLGHVSTPEPFARLFNQGYIQAYAYTDARGMYVEAAEVEEKDGKFFHQGREVAQQFGKMGKSLKNAIAPDDICGQYGCDTLRLYEMYLGPLDQSKIWRTRDILGVHRFLQRLWRVLVDEPTGKLNITNDPAPLDLKRLTHKTIKRVSEAMDSMSFNVAIAALIELNNELSRRYGGGQESGGRSQESGVRDQESQSPPLPRGGISGSAHLAIPREIVEPMVLCLAPLAPHVSEELWEKLGHLQSLSHEPWPTHDPAMLVENNIDYPVQVNGKLRGKVTVPTDADQKTIEAAALADEKVKAAMAGKSIRKVILVKGKLINLVVG